MRLQRDPGLMDCGHDVVPPHTAADAGNCYATPCHPPIRHSTLKKASQAWDVEEMYASLPDEEFVPANTALHVDLIRDFKPNVVVNSLPRLCLPARTVFRWLP